MAEMSEPKRQKQDENADRLSALPDSVLCHVMSFLPTKTTVAMSVLSRRWRHLWEHLQVLDFSDDSHEFFDDSGDLFKRFAVFVNGVLALRKARDVRTFRLACGHTHSDPFHANSVTTWARAAIGPHLEEFNLTLFSSDGRGFVMPHSLFSTCTKLTSLSLCGGIHVRPQQASSIRLLSLKSLHLDIDSVESVDALLAGCPVLEKLYLSFAPKQMVKVSVPSTLKKLKFAVENHVETVLEIHAPGLKYLSITQSTVRCTLSVGNLYNVEQASLDVNATEEPVDTLIRLLTSIRRTRILALRRLTTKWLLRAPPAQDFPNFCQLVQLDLILPWFNSNFLVNLLQKCHKLQSLMIQIEKGPPALSRSWTQPTSVPVCLASHLTFFHLTGYQGYQDELEFVGYIMRRGLVLNTMIIYAATMMENQRKYRILRDLFAVPRGSKWCRATFC